MRRRMPPRPKPREGKGGAAPPQIEPMDMNTVKGILREYDRGAYGEEFRGDRLAKIGVLGKGSTSTVWKAVDVDHLRVLAVKEMVVCDSKQSAILRHELGVLHPQLQHLIPPKKFRLSGRRGNRAALAAAAASVSNMREADSSAAPPAAAAAAAAANGSSQRKNSGKDGRDGGGGDAAAGRNSKSNGKVAANSVERPGKCPYMPRYFGSFVTQDDVGRPCVSIVLEHVSGVDLSRWIERMGGTTGEGGDEQLAAAADEAAALQPPGPPLQPQLATPTPPTPLSFTQPPPIPIPEVWLARVCRDMLEALRYLHERRRIHRDVKPGNLMLGPEGARLVDFGSTIVEDEDEGDRMHGTIRFMSPERLCAKPYRPSSDLWAAGLTVASAALGENPIPHSHNKFENAEYAEAAFRLVREHRAAAGLSPSLLNFLKAALEADPDKRPTVEQMLAHPFVRANPDAAAEGDFSGDFVGGDGGGGGGGGFSGGGGGFLGVVRRGGSVLNIGGRKKDGERARTAAAAAAAALETKEKQQRQQQQQQQQNQQRQQRLLSSAFSSHSSTGGVGGGVGGGSDRLDEAWSEQIRETLRRLARESIDDVDASDVIRRVLTARKSRWKNPMGSGDISLKSLDYSHLAAELDVSRAELRSLFGTLLTNMDGENGESSSSWSSPVTSPRSSSPPPAMLPPLGAAPPPPPPTTTTNGRSRCNSRDTDGEAIPSPLRLPYIRRDPFPRRRPTPLVLSPGPGTPRPVSAVSASALSAISGMTAHSATGDSPAAPPAPPGAALITLAARVSEGSPQSLPVSRTMSATVQRSVSGTSWTRGWTGINRSRRPGDSRRSVSGVFAMRAGVSAAARAHVRKGTPAVVAVGSGDAAGSERGGGGGAWWKWGQRRRLLPRVFKVDKPGGGDASGGDGSSGAEIRTTELPSATSRATAAAEAAAAQPPLTITPPLSKFDEEADGNVGGDREPAPASERNFGLGAVIEPLPLGALAPGEVGVVGAGAGAMGSGSGSVSPFTRTLESRLGGCDGPAPAWASNSIKKRFTT